MSSWLFYALLSALCAAFVSIFGKVGVAGLDTSAVTQVAPIDKLSVVFAVLIALIFFGEHVSLMHGIAIALIAAGGLMLVIFP